MKQRPSERLYNLLPAIYRLRDDSEHSLKALLAVMENELQILETDMDNLYDNWFIETCDDWVVPYIGDLLGVQELYAESPRTYGQERRAYVANSLAYRRRKGTAPVLEQLVRDISGWRARVVEYFERVATSQNLNHLRAASTTVSLRAEKQPELLGTPFEKNVAYTTEVRHIKDGGQYNISDIGIFIWRLDSYPLERSTARLIPQSVTSHHCFTFSSLGKDQPLFNIPQTETEITHLADEINVPGELRPPPLDAELETLRQAKADSEELPKGKYFEPFQPVVKIFKNGQLIPPEEILISDLSKWKLPPDSKIYQKSNSKTGELSEIILPISVAIDPKWGRLAFPLKTLPQQVEVSYAYGFSGDIGGGPYARDDSLPKTLFQDAPLLRWYVQQSSLVEVVQAWNQIAQLWQPCHDLIHIPLARLEIDLKNRRITQLDPDPNSYPIVKRSNPKINPEFQAGIIKGLLVTGESGARLVAITPGTAVNSQGQRLELSSYRQIYLRPFADQTVLVVISPPDQGQANGNNIQVLFKEQVKASDVPLAQLQINKNGRLEQPANIGVRTDFTAGIVKENSESQLNSAFALIKLKKNTDKRGKSNGKKIDKIGVEAINSQGQLRVFPLKAINSQGQLIHLTEKSSESQNSEPKTALTLEADEIIQKLEKKLENEFRLDSAHNSKISVTLYLIPPAKANASQVNIVSNSNTSFTILDNPNVDIVPDGNGSITILDNRSYVGDLILKIPSANHLQLTAASGYRPHLQGNLSVVGLASSDEEAGEFSLNGWLIEGRLAVVGGYLQKLQIDHCTLVPQKGGLVISPVQPTAPCEDENLTLMAAIRYCLDELRQGLNPNSNNNPALIQNFVTQLTQVVVQEATAIVTDFKALFRQQNWKQDKGQIGQCCFLPETPQCQASLGLQSLVLNRTICGPLALQNKVTTLTIRDSIIDSDSDSSIDKEEKRPGMIAIAAPTTNANLSTTTVLGRTVVRTLNASDSLFTEQVFAAQRQTGCVRFSYLPNSSQTPPRYRCQPDLVLSRKLSALPAIISSLAANPSQGVLFLGTAGEGVFRGAALGTGTISSNGEQVTGSGTKFSSELRLGDTLTAAGQTKTIVSIDNTDSDTNLTVYSPFKPNLTPGTNFSFIKNNESDNRVDYWQQCLADSLSNKIIMSLMAYSRPALGIIYTTGDKTTIFGYESIFNQNKELKIGDVITVTVVSKVVIFALYLLIQSGFYRLALLLLQVYPAVNKTRTVTEIADDVNLKVSAPFINDFSSQDFALNYLLAGTTNGNIFLSRDNGENWLLLDIAKVDLSTISLLPFATPGRGKIKIFKELKEVRGQGTRFKRELKVGDMITAFIKNPEGESPESIKETRKVVRIDSNHLLTVDSAFSKIKQPVEITEFTINRLEPTNTEVSTFAVHCQAGSGTIAVDPNNPKQIIWSPPEDSTTNQNGASVSTQIKIGDAITVEGQTRTVISINNSMNTFTINFPFEMGESSDIDSNWEGKPFIINNLFAGTGGGGIFRFTEDGKSWTSVNQGLTNRYITCLAVDDKGHLLAGTMGSGIFQSTDNGNHWQAVNRGLTNGYITCLQVAKKGQIFAGTAGGGVFYSSTDYGRDWKPINGISTDKRKRLTNLHVTAIAIVENVDELEKPPILFAGTDGSGIFRSTDSGQTWTAVYQGFPHWEITTLLSVSNPDGSQQIWAGTVVGSVLRTLTVAEMGVSRRDGEETDQSVIGDRWVTVNQGLTHVEEKLLILNRLKPQFTASTYGDPSYVQLRLDTAEEIRTGAEDGAEMGAFNFLKQPQREANIKASLDEYLRFGLETGIFYMT